MTGKVQWLALNRQLGYLWENSEFYRTKLSQSGLDPSFSVQSWDDLSLLPFTSKDELRVSLHDHPPLGAHLAAQRSALVQIQSTSGTSGTPSYIGLTRADSDVWSELGCRAFSAAGLVSGQSVCHAWSMSKGFTGGLPVAQMARHMGLCLLPIGAEAGVDRLLTVIGDQRPDGLLGTPSYLTYLGEKSEDVLGVPACELGVQSLVVGAEPGGGLAPIRRHLESLWGATCCEVLGNSDIAPIIWGECLERGGMHLLGEEMVLVELLEPNGDSRVEPVVGAIGELVYSALRREASPLLRFRSGDRVEVLAASCTCGRKGFRLRCTGRTDDMLIVRGVNVWPSAVQEIVARMRPGLTGAMRIVKDFEGHSTTLGLRIKVEATVDPATWSDVSAELATVIKSQLAFSPVIEVVPAGSIAIPGATKIQLIEQGPSE